MKLVVFCLSAIFCCSLASTLTNKTDRTLERRKLQEVHRWLSVVRLNLQQNEQMLSTPPRNIEDCCCLSALHCFRTKLKAQFNITERSKLYRSLNNPITEQGVDYCNSGNVRPTCQDCDSHPKENASEFFNRLESLIQRAIDRLSMN